MVVLELESPQSLKLLPSGAKKSDQLEQLISEQLGEIDRFNAQIAEVQSSKMVAGRSKDRIRPCDGTGGLP